MHTYTYTYIYLYMSLSILHITSAWLRRRALKRAELSTDNYIPMHTYIHI